MTNERGNPSHPPVTDQATYQAEWPAGRPIPQWPRLSAGHSDDLTS